MASSKNVQVSPSDGQSILSVGNIDGGVMGNPSKSVSIVGEADSMDPATAHRRVAELRHQLPNRHLLAPWRLAGPLLDVLDEAGEHPDLEVGGAARQENIVGVPVQRSHSGLQWLLDVLSDPPEGKGEKDHNA